MYTMSRKRYAATAARAHLSELLDLAEQGVAVVIERLGVEFTVERVEPRRSRHRKRPPRPRIEILDPAVESGQWSWSWKSGLLRFTKRASR
jgi:antitoxin (DNA-binding transcriptional repressor) of toxin-antitoxin stability system